MIQNYVFILINKDDTIFLIITVRMYCNLIFPDSFILLGMEIPIIISLTFALVFHSFHWMNYMKTLQSIELDITHLRWWIIFQVLFYICAKLDARKARRVILFLNILLSCLNGT